MDKVVFAIVVALAVFSETVTAITPPAGRCKRCSVSLVPLTLDYFEAHKPWRVAYATAVLDNGGLDSEVRDGQRMAYNWYKIVDTITTRHEVRKTDSVFLSTTSHWPRDFLSAPRLRLNQLTFNSRMKQDLIKGTSSSGTYEFSTAIINNVINEDTVDDNGNKKLFYSYPLAVTTEDGLLFYRCSDDGDAEVDTRYIWIPANETLSDAGLQYLMQVDSQCGFRGQLQKLSH